MPPRRRYACWCVTTTPTEFDYVAGAEQALDEANTSGWTVVRVHDDWTTVFGD
jgi:hypothetical protein